MNKIFNKDNFLCGGVFVLVAIIVTVAILLFEYLKTSFHMGFISVWDYLNMWRLDIKSLMVFSKTLLNIFCLGVFWGYVATKYEKKGRVFLGAYLFLILLTFILSNSNPTEAFALAKMYFQMYTFDYLTDIFFALAQIMIFLLLASFFCYTYVLKKDQKHLHQR